MTRQPALKFASKAKRKTPEANLQKTVVAYIRMRKVPNLVWGASMNGVKLGIRAASRMKEQGMEAGEPDLYFLIDGCYFGLELKNGKAGVQSVAQKDFERRVNASGGEYYIARDIEQALTYLEDCGAIHKQVRRNYRMAA